MKIIHSLCLYKTMTYHLAQKNQDSGDNDDKNNSDDDLNEKTEE